MKKEIANHLLNINAVLLKPEEPFTWTSGIKSPIYCDNRLTLSYNDIRNDIAQGIADIIKEKFSECDMIMGTATAGIPHAAIVAHKMLLPMGYVRSSAKKHGRQNQIEGVIKEGLKVVVIEDLISTGKSSIEVVKSLRSTGCNVLGVIAIFSYELKISEENFKSANCPIITLTNYDTLVETALETGKIKDSDVEKLKKWREDPENWLN